jgi:ArsR family transcriptional regulator, arsenate/arsenite/antimonite-responsive transcriptional repressor
MQLDRVFEALASGPRRQILAYLSGGELSTSALAERFNMSAPAISRHLSILELAGLVSSERQGQFVLYRLNPDNLVNSLTGYALEVCPVGRPLKQEAKARASAAKAAAPSTPARTAKVTKAIKTVAAAKRAKPAKG